MHYLLNADWISSLQKPKSNGTFWVYSLQTSRNSQCTRLILFRLHLNSKIFSCDCFKRTQETGWETMEHKKSRIIHGSIRSIGMPYWASQLSHHLCRFCLQTLIYQILTNNSPVVRLSHTVRTQEEWMRKGRISLDFHLKIIDFVYFTLIWLIFYHFFRIALSRLIVIDKSYRFYLKYKGKRNYKNWKTLR